MRKLAKALLFFPIIVFLLNGCTEPVEDGLPGDESDPSYYHAAGWEDNHQSGNDFSTNPQNCKACHGEYANGGPADVSCFSSSCHQDFDKCNCCHDNNGTSASHKTHNTVNNYYRGPGQLACQDCHNSANHPNFTDGRNSANTTVCNTCHSPGGAYDGVNDTTIGAKNNWSTGVYTGSLLDAGKEKWCVTCHDDVPGNSKQDGTGVDAPNVAGDNSTYGYYANGHGNAPNDTELLCTDCHDVSDDVSVTHIDEDDRTYTFDAGDYNDGSTYQAGYRLKSIGGQVPMKIPANAISGDETDYRLCFSAGCHVYSEIFDAGGGAPLTFDTNFNISEPNPPMGYSYDRTEAAPGVSLNVHVYHLDTAPDTAWDSDWDLSTGGNWDSFTSCVTCHNVHGAEGYAGSTNEAMIRDGKLVNGRPDTREGFRFSYVIVDGALPNVTSSGATREDSIGAVFRSDKMTLSGKHMCKGCHGTPPYSAPPDVSYNATGEYLEYYRPNTQ